jgi:hypothetical protein
MKISWVKKQVDQCLTSARDEFGEKWDQAEPIEVQLDWFINYTRKGDPRVIAELNRWIAASDNASATKLLTEVVRLLQGVNGICEDAQIVQDKRRERSRRVAK